MKPSLAMQWRQAGVAAHAWLDTNSLLAWLHRQDYIAAARMRSRSKRSAQRSGQGLRFDLPRTARSTPTGAVLMDHLMIGSRPRKSVWTVAVITVAIFVADCLIAGILTTVLSAAG
jgi:hypothetical protein